MKRLFRMAAAALAAAALLVPAAHAQSFRTYVSSLGNDLNPCTVQLPCRLVNRALDATAAGGEIWILDSANFNQGTVNINKSVSITAVPGEIASILAVGGTPAIAVSTLNTKVALRNLVIGKNVTNPGTDGVVVTGGDMLSVENCLFANLPGDAIHASHTYTKIYVRNTVFRAVGGYALWMEDGPNATLADSQILSGGQGVRAYQHSLNWPTHISVTDSTISGVANGAWASTNAVAGAEARVFVTRSTIHHTTYAIRATNAGALTTVTNSTVAGNAVAITIDSVGVVKSTGNNYITDNVSGDIGTLTTIAPR